MNTKAKNCNTMDSTQVQLFDQEDNDILIKQPGHSTTKKPSSSSRKNCNSSNNNNKNNIDRKCPKGCLSSRREKILAILSILLLILLIALAILFFVVKFKKDNNVCMDPHCIKLAAGLLSSLDETVDPCTDFYQFACGNWIRSHPIPDDRPTVSNFEQPTIDLEYALKQLLDNETHSQHSSIESARTFYHSCENETLVLRTWRQTFNEAKNKLGGWPVLDKWWRPSLLTGTTRPSQQGQQQRQFNTLLHNGSIPFDIILPLAGQRTISKLYGLLSINYSQDSLFKFSVGADDKNSSIHVFQVDQGALTLLIREFYLSPEGYEERDAYLDLMTECVLLLGADGRTARAEMAAVMQFETDLANISRDESRQDVDSTYFKIGLQDLRNSNYHLKWNIFLEAVYPNVKWPKDTEFVIYCSEFLDDLNFLIVKYEERIITNYLIWRWFYSEVLSQLPDPYFMAHFKFHRALQKFSDMKVPQLRWHSCIRQVNQHMLHATGALYVQQYFNPSAKQRAIEMIEMIKDAFHESLKENEWLTPETRKVASEKIDAMILKTGYPDFILNFTQVDNYYKEFKHSGPDFFRTKFLFEYLNNRLHYHRIFEPVDKNRWTSGSAVVNAFYSPNTNEIMFPAGILQPVFYSEHYPWSMNFGGIGVVIGHEITHGFDDKGRQYDKDGNIREWWDNETIHMFEKKAQCIEDQYSKYYVEQVKLKVNGKNTKGENIADNGGLKQAYKAYLKWSVQNKAEPLLPGIKYSHNQLFFINYAQIWCGSMNDKEFIRKIKTSVHSPGMIRVKGPLQNMQQFADIFKCKPDSPMNPSPKCTIW